MKKIYLLIVFFGLAFFSFSQNLPSIEEKTNNENHRIR